MSKPVVKYSKALEPVVVGQRAKVYITTPHPVLDLIAEPKWVSTSQVVNVNGYNFETLNTLYEWGGNDE